ncbi:MAG TPA: hypothetical protein PLI09_04385 [Candidatus Hydrogenedentes bacterium]|nr:hypothetical protein [Candidatus Hydrogenedentota bacterium]
MNKKQSHKCVNRREFMGQAGFCTAAMAAVVGTANAQDAPAKPTELLPTIQLGNYAVTRLISGYNPIGGYSHATSNLSVHMREYYTVERTVDFLKHSEAQGINTFQFDLTEKIEKVLEILWKTDTKLQFLCLNSGNPGAPDLSRVMEYKPFAIAHHGGVTDSLFRAGKAGMVHDYVKKVHDKGVLAGVSAHNPDNIKRMADEGWENDFFMTCAHHVTRTREEMEKQLGQITFGEPFFESDPPRMASIVRQIDKPCLMFKILAAGRRCDSQDRVGEAFKWAFENIKKTDAVIVGMFQQYQDEIALNAEFTRKYGQV